MSGAGLSLEELLHLFPISHVGYALRTAGLPAEGTKEERVARLLALGRQRGASAENLLLLFKAEALRPVATRFGITQYTKAEMAAALAAALPDHERRLTPEGPPRTQPTFPAVLGFLRRLVLPWRRIRSEGDAETAIAAALRREFSAVATQYSVGGYHGYRIDIDLADGTIGVEVKLGKALVGAASEAYRAVGQAVIYDRRKYKGRVLLALVCHEGVRQHPALLELEELLKDLGITCAFVALR